MKGIYELLLAGKSSLEGAMENVEGMKGCVSKYTETYLRCFHLRWPILHAPTLNIEIYNMPVPLSASVCLIGAWLQDNVGRNERCNVLKVHETLLERLLQSVVSAHSSSITIVRLLMSL